MKPGEETLGEASQMLRDILQSNKDKKVHEQLNDNNNTLTPFDSVHHPALKTFCTASESDQEMMSSMMRAKASSSKAISDDTDANSDNYGNLSGDESDLDSTCEQVNHDDLHKENDLDNEVTSPAENVSTSDSKEAKRARVENILTTIRQSPQAGFESLTQASFEMKRQKRKQPAPQQHDVRSILAPETKKRRVEMRLMLQEHIRNLEEQRMYAVKKMCDLEEQERDVTNGREDAENEMYEEENGLIQDNFLHGSSRDKDALTPTTNGLSPRSNTREEPNFLSSTPIRFGGRTEEETEREARHTPKSVRRDGIPLQNGDVPIASILPPQVGLHRVALSLKSEIIQAVTQAVDTVLEKHANSMSQQQPEPHHQHRQQQHHQQQQQQQNQLQQQQREQQQKEQEFRQTSLIMPRLRQEREALRETMSNTQPERKPELIVPYPDHLSFLERFSQSRMPADKISAFEPLHRSETDFITPHTTSGMSFTPHYPYYMHAGLLPPVFPVEPEQTEALPLVVSNQPKKKRTKVTDTRLSPRAKSALLEAGPGGLPSIMDHVERGHHGLPAPFPHYLPHVLPTSVAITNPSLHRSDLFSFRFHESMYDPHMASPPVTERHSPKSPPDSMHLLKSDIFDTSASESMDGQTSQKTCTLTPMHLRKAKLMFFYTRYPNSGILKIYFPDVSFNKNNTAQLVKWFSNFREFFYIQMEKYARQAVADGCKHADDLFVNRDSELFRHLNLHYNRNNQIEAPDSFRLVVEATLREFFRAIYGKKDLESSWKKAIYKVIARMDEQMPEFFKSPNWMEQLGEVP